MAPGAGEVALRGGQRRGRGGGAAGMAAGMAGRGKGRRAAALLAATLLAAAGCAAAWTCWDPNVDSFGDSYCQGMAYGGSCKIGRAHV